MDSSKASLKAVLLRIGNSLSTIPVSHAVHMKKTYKSMKMLLTCIRYDEHEWLLCGDLKVVALVLGLQGGYTKYCCFLCEWDSRARTAHDVRLYWPTCQLLQPGTQNVMHKAMVGSSNILLPFLHIKLGLMKNFVKGMDKSESAFQEPWKKFPRVSEAKVKEGVFIGPHIQELL